MLMNLPALAIEFLDVFRQSDVELSTIKPIHTRCYCFVRHSLESDISKGSKQVEADIDARRRICEALDISSEVIFTDVPQDPPNGTYLTNWNVRFVRNTAPMQNMYCLEFDLHPEGITKAAKRPRIV